MTPEELHAMAERTRAVLQDTLEKWKARQPKPTYNEAVHKAREDAIDELVIKYVDEESAWEPPITVPPAK